MAALHLNQPYNRPKANGHSAQNGWLRSAWELGFHHFELHVGITFFEQPLVWGKNIVASALRACLIADCTPIL